MKILLIVLGGFALLSVMDPLPAFIVALVVYAAMNWRSISRLIGVGNGRRRYNQHPRQQSRDYLRQQNGYNRNAQRDFRRDDLHDSDYWRR